MNSVAVVVLTVIADFVFGCFARALWPRVKAGETVGRINVAISRPADVMVFGSSKVRHGYDDDEMSRRLGLDVYNAGLNGLGLLATRAMVDARVSGGAGLPKLIVFDANCMGEEDERLIGFTPWVHSSPWLRNRLNVHGPYSFRFLSNSSFWLFGEKFFAAIFNYGRGESRFGFSPLIGALDENAMVRTNDHISVKLPNWYLQELSGLHDDVARLGSKLVVVFSPSWSPDGPSFRDGIRNLCKSSEIPLLEIDLPYDYRMHKDTRHLNGDGAVLFTKRLCAELTGRGIVDAQKAVPEGK